MAEKKLANLIFRPIEKNCSSRKEQPLTEKIVNPSTELLHFLDQISRKQVQRSVVALKVMCIGAAIVVSSSSLYFTYSRFRASQEQISSFAEQTSPPSVTLRDSYKPVPKGDLQVILDKNIFGPLNVAPTPATTQQKTVTKSNYKLVGTYVGLGETSSAIIEDPRKGIQEVFQLNEAVFDGGKLSLIRSDRVEISSGGQVEVLLLEEGAADIKGGSTIVSGEEIVVAEADVDAALANLPLLLTELRAVPYFKDGQAVGLRLFAIKSGSLFDKIGLKNGDILKSINENSLADFTQAIKLFEKLKAERSLKVQLERNKEEKTFSYSIR